MEDFFGEKEKEMISYERKYSAIAIQVPFGHGQWLSEHIPKQYLKAHLIEGEGHISIWLDYMDTMFKELTSVQGK